MDRTIALVDAEDAYSIDEIRALAPSDFFPLHDPAAGIGSVDARMWLALPVINPTDEEIERYLHLVTNFMQEIDVWIETDAGLTNLLSQDMDAVFSNRPISHPNLVMQINLPPATQGTIWIAFRSHGTTAVPIRILPETDFIAQTWDHALSYMIFYMAVAIMTVVSLLAFCVNPRRVFLTYGLYSGSVVMYLLHRDGFTFQYLWPNAPLWNSFASLPLGVALPALASLFSQSYLESRKDYPRIHILLGVMVVLSVAIVPAALVFGDIIMKEVAALWTSVVALLLLSVGVYALWYRGPGLIFFCLGWFGIVCASAVTVAAVMGADVSRTMVLDAIRYAMVFDAAMIGLAVITAVMAIRRERDASFEDKFLTLRENMVLQGRLTQLEDRYMDARLRSSRSAELAEATAHDIRQPIYALRQTLTGMRESTTEGPRVHDVEHQLHYLEAIVEEFVRESGLKDREEARENPEEGAEVAQVMDALSSMFAADAAAQNISLRVMPTHARTKLELLAVLRVAGNLVSNAIRHSGSDRVLVGCHWKNGVPWLCVLDRGRGPSPDMAQVLESQVADDQTGGLGLHIVKGIADEAGVRLRLHALPGGGTCLAFELPQAQGADFSRETTFELT